MKSGELDSDLGSWEAGAALLEAALLLPVLLLLVFGLMEVSFYFWTSSLAVKAVQLGARRAAVSDSVAVGPGLDLAESSTYWEGLPPGTPCFPDPGARSICPQIDVRCDLAGGCRCKAGSCNFRFVAARMKPILAAMQAVMPELRSDNVEISYATNGLGYIARPLPVPVDVRVSLVGVRYTPLFFSDLLGAALPLNASALLPSEDLLTR